MNSDTPRTEATAEICNRTESFVPFIALCQQLERELAAAKTEIERLSGSMSMSEAKAHEAAADLRVQLARVTAERDEADLLEQMATHLKCELEAERDQLREEIHRAFLRRR